MNGTRKNIFKYVLIVILLIITTIAVAYAFFEVTIVNSSDTKTVVVTPDESTVEYLTSNSINLNATEPGVDAEVIFSIKLSGSTNFPTHTSYAINWNVTKDTFTKLSKPDLVYNIYSSNDGSNWTEVKSNIDATTLSIGDNKILLNQSLDAEAGKTSTIYWKVKLSYLSLTDVDQSANMNQIFTGAITVTDVQ